MVHVCPDTVTSTPHLYCALFKRTLMVNCAPAWHNCVHTHRINWTLRSIVTRSGPRPYVKRCTHTRLVFPYHAQMYLLPRFWPALRNPLPQPCWSTATSFNTTHALFYVIIKRSLCAVASQWRTTQTRWLSLCQPCDYWVILFIDGCLCCLLNNCGEEWSQWL